MMIQRRVVVALAAVALALLVTAVMFLLTGPRDESPVREPAPALRTSIATPTPSPPPEVSTATPTPQPTANEGTVEAEPLYIFTAPTSVVFEKAGESATLKVWGRYADGTERVVGAQAGPGVTFAAADQGIAEVDFRGLITAVSPGGTTVLVEHGRSRAEVPVIVYGDYVHVPLYNPQRVVGVAPGTRIVVNRVIVRPNGEVYDPGLAQQIATDYDGTIVAEWLNLGSFCLEVPVETIAELEALLLRLDSDPRVAGIDPDLLYKLNDYHAHRGAAVQFARVPEITALSGCARSLCSA